MVFSQWFGLIMGLSAMCIMILEHIRFRKSREEQAPRIARKHAAEQYHRRIKGGILMLAAAIMVFFLSKVEQTAGSPFVKLGYLSILFIAGITLFVLMARDFRKTAEYAIKAHQDLAVESITKLGKFLSDTKQDPTTSEKKERKQ